jgi:heat shock protein HtpX
MKFMTRSLLVLLALYGLVFAIGDWYLARDGAELWLAIVFAVAFIGFQYLIGPWMIELFLDIAWVDLRTGLPEPNRQFVEKLCADRGLKVPRVGIIHSGTPNAFSYGHIPSDARVVVTQGLLDVLTPEEVNAVLAHEIGHIEHWDFAMITIAALAPLLLYQIYAFTRHNNNTRAVAYGSYLCYWISQFVVLLLNRTREYFADHYSAEVTHQPDALSSALVKIAYGMVRSDGEYQKVMKLGTKDEKSSWRKQRRIEGGIAVMGISNLKSGASLALSGANPADASAVMQWDLVNPWARVYELNSTHPLTALRVKQLNEQAAEMHQPSEYSLPVDQRIRWGAFPLEVVLWAAPVACIVTLFAMWSLASFFRSQDIVPPEGLAPILLIAAGALWILRTIYRYRGSFGDASVGALMRDLEVSEMRPRAVRLTGKILGRGVPGAFWSADLVLQDPSGYIFILYRQSIPLARFLFAVTAAEGYIGQDVTIEGWFRRSLRPYVEMSKITGKDGSTHRAYSRWIQYALALAAVVAGWYWLSGGF